METFDLKTIEADETATIKLLHPATGDEIGATITVYGQDSDKYRSEDRKADTRLAEYMRRNPRKTMPAEDRERINKQKVAACIKSIDGLANNGQAVTAEQACDIPWIYEQIVVAMFDRSVFIKGLQQN